MHSTFGGCGYVGRQVACHEIADGGDVCALVRTADSAAQLAKLGISSRQVDFDQDVPVPALQLTDQVLYWFAPPPPHGDQDLRLSRVLVAIEPGALPRRIVLVSTTGVYGDCRGEWVNETRPLNPQTTRGQRRVHAEQLARSFGERHNVPVVALRVPGIYGPGKLPLRRLHSGAPVLAPEFSPWSNRIHAHDLVTACLAAARKVDPAPVYTVSDGHPTTMADFFFQVADAHGLPRPPTLTRDAAERQLSTEMRSYLAESKRIDNTLMKEDLGVVPDYPNLASGLGALEH
jgi:nucleoside-diphosphate-sugar epimerase